MSDSSRFFEDPILNSPYDAPTKYWELDDRGQPTQKVADGRRLPNFQSPIPRPKKVVATQGTLEFENDLALLSEEQQRLLATRIGDTRRSIEIWRAKNYAGASPETVRLLNHWRNHRFEGPRPFFCQLEAVETVIWLTEVAPNEREGKAALEALAVANADNGELGRLALKLATGAGKTTVMAMLIAWQTVNAVRRPHSKRYTRGFLIVAPGVTIRDRLRVLLPNDAGNLYAMRQLVPTDLLQEVQRAKVVITNYHAFMLRERVDISKGGRRLLQGRGPALDTLETEGQMLQRVMPELMGMRNIIVINDEAHHCYREKPGDGDDGKLKGDEKKEAEENAKAARVWVSGLEAVQRTIGVARVVDLSATPFYLSGSGYGEGTLFPWTMSDFSLMDAIECGIVKLPRVPISDNIPGEQMPMFRNLWDYIGKHLPKKVGGAAKSDPRELPAQLLTALDVLYGHYEKTYVAWQDEHISVPPCFIVVCNNTATSKLVYDYISGYLEGEEGGPQTPIPGALELFRNSDEHGNAFSRPNTILVDSRQLESGDLLDDNFRKIAAGEIEQFKREALERGGPLADELRAGKEISDATLLREVMNTVGKSGQLGGQVRCVVSVSMLTEGWDANTVTHVLGVRAFSTQLLCEQVVGRALRRQSYDLNEHGRFNAEYADILGIPFDFTAEPQQPKVVKPRETIQVKAIRPERDSAEICFPRVEGYRVELPRERVTAQFTPDSVFRITPELVGATETVNSGIIGEESHLTLEHTKVMRRSALVMHLTARLVQRWGAKDGTERAHLYNDLKRVTREWIDGYLRCEGDTTPAQLTYKVLADEACERIITAINLEHIGSKPVMAVLDPFVPTGTTGAVNFTTSRPMRWETDARRSHVNWAICDSTWELELCRVLEGHTRVRAYTRNQNLGFEVPYRHLSQVRRYLPDFIARLDDGHGDEDLLNLVIEVKGYRGEDAKAKANTMRAYWIPGVNNLGVHGRWAFAEFREVSQMRADFAEAVTKLVNEKIEAAAAGALVQEES
jgi:type III restriction enzyme